MGYTVNYKGPYLKVHKQALDDCRDFMGGEYFDRVAEELRTTDKGPAFVRTSLAFMVGVEGRAADALIEEFMPSCHETGDYGYRPNGGVVFVDKEGNAIDG